MAFKLDFIFSGLNVVGGYVEVSSPAISADEKKLSFGVNFSVNHSEPLLTAESYTCDYDINGGNPFEQAYAYLKTLEKFKFAEVIS
ncbi:MULTISPECIES: hypothetical protein [Klebsiella pneumoniae complex]|uniref:hypothetical protein n=1 Tax=Klebsiella pneumoniae complex TaxID=3390273 RepID=UPI001083969D|nr:hypothetical protein [Klebsiella quasipneumoniae]MCP5923639.1 hypothetical protein [Klebsiella pneumoniae]VGA05313.1 Uncharacterised protein [Klebsiella quasipneumoniae]HBT3650453.1 hypothetical protein [Klebsiella pneumoniae]HEE0881288.1 hypothetical protein [Klebsiella pneumoniae]